MNIDFSLIGQRVKQKRKAVGLTQEKLAEELSVTVGYVSQIESGRVKVNLEMLGKIAAVLNCDVGYLVSGTASEQSTYLSTEFQKRFDRMNSDDKRLLLDFADMLIKNSQKKSG
ncbi:MAG: helix-turn-helix transcriptional regulator [Ruminococcaceae bacterium]|nr:helix-turn-helix transcriptional regulator [Oscillospiraceae bacterium]